MCVRVCEIVRECARARTGPAFSAFRERRRKLVDDGSHLLVCEASLVWEPLVMRKVKSQVSSE